MISPIGGSPGSMGPIGSNSPASAKVFLDASNIEHMGNLASKMSPGISRDSVIQGMKDSMADIQSTMKDNPGAFSQNAIGHASDLTKSVDAFANAPQDSTAFHNLADDVVNLMSDC